MSPRLPDFTRFRLLACAALVACTGSASSTPPQAAPSPDGSDESVAVSVPDASIDAAKAFPAFRPSAPQVENAGGPVLKSPRIVAVVFDGDPLAAELTAFVGEMGGRPDYWARATAEYGVGPLRSTKTVVAHEAPPTTAAVADVQAWLTKHTEGPTSLLGAFDEQTMYTVFYPSSTAVVLDGSGPQCQAFGGYHLDLRRPDGRVMFYSAIPRCDALNGLTSIELATTAASHEWAEGAADPHPSLEPAFIRVDAAHYAWAVSFSDYPVAEIGDMCALTPDGVGTPPGFKHKVQRLWSNAEARAGRDPCVPAAAGSVFFNAVPVADERVTITPPGMESVTTKGIHVPVGTQKTIDLELFSVAPTAPWTVSAFDVRALLGEPKRLALSIDRAKGKNGDTLKLTIRALAPGPLGGAPFAVYSEAGGVMNVALGFVQN